jgi:hypothetical protein
MKTKTARFLTQLSLLSGLLITSHIIAIPRPVSPQQAEAMTKGLEKAQKDGEKDLEEGKKPADAIQKVMEAGELTDANKAEVKSSLEKYFDSQISNAGSPQEKVDFEKIKAEVLEHVDKTETPEGLQGVATYLQGHADMMQIGVDMAKAQLENLQDGKFDNTLGAEKTIELVTVEAKGIADSGIFSEGLEKQLVDPMKQQISSSQKDLEASQKQDEAYLKQQEEKAEEAPAAESEQPAHETSEETHHEESHEES